MKPCRVIDCSYEKNPLNFVVDPIENGRLAAILDFYDNVLRMCNREVPPGESRQKYTIANFR